MNYYNKYQLYKYNLSCIHNYNTRASNTYYTQCAPLPCQETLRRMWTNAKSSHEKLMRQTAGIRSLLEKTAHKNLLINIKSEHIYTMTGLSLTALTMKLSMRYKVVADNLTDNK